MVLNCYFEGKIGELELIEDVRVWDNYWVLYWLFIEFVKV